MARRNSIRLTKLDGTPDTGKAVGVYNWQAAEPYYSTKIGDMIEIPNLGEYYLDMATSAKVTLLVGGSVKESYKGIEFLGDDGFVGDDKVTQAKMAANSIGTDEVINYSIDHTKLADDSIKNRHISDDAVREPNIQDGSVTPAKTTFAEEW